MKKLRKGVTKYAKPLRRRKQDGVKEGVTPSCSPHVTHVGVEDSALTERGYDPSQLNLFV